MSAILPPALLFSDESNGGTSIKGHQASPLLAGRRSLYSDWLGGRGGLAAPLFYVTFPARPEVLTNCTSNPALHMCKIMYGVTHAHS